MKNIIINCDVGESIGNESLIMPFIDAANIACGYHAGDVKTMSDTLELCVKHGVKIGAHPSYFDKENFGRSELKMEESELYDLIIQQILLLSEIAGIYDQTLNHVKPHGALYNQSAKDPAIANIVARAVRDFNHELILYGLSGSHSISQAESLGIKTANEVFADRTYQDDGSLTPRTMKNALIENLDEALKQASLVVNEGVVVTVSGKRIEIRADTICIHGDGRNALLFAEGLLRELK